MDEKGTRKRLKQIETEIKHMEKQIKRSERGLRIKKSRKKTFLMYLLIISVASLGMFLNDRSFGLNSPLCYFALYIPITLVVAWFFSGLFEDWEISNIKKSMKMAECWIKYYQNEKERILREHPELRNEDIRPHKLHYWDVFLYYSMCAIIALTVLTWATKSRGYFLIPEWTVVFIIFMAGMSLYSWKFKKCPEMEETHG